MLRIASILLYTTVSLFMVGCISGINISIDQVDYVVGDTVAVTLLNANTESFYVSSCQPFLIQKRVEGKWNTVNQKECVQNNIEEILSGDQVDSTEVVIESGTYRAFYTVGLECDADKPLSTEYCTSLSFKDVMFRVKEDEGRVCPLHYSPVCGTALEAGICATEPCSSVEVYKTYSNSCFAYLAGSEVILPDECGDIEGLTI